MLSSLYHTIIHGFVSRVPAPERNWFAWLHCISLGFDGSSNSYSNRFFIDQSCTIIMYSTTNKYGSLRQMLAVISLALNKVRAPVMDSSSSAGTGKTPKRCLRLTWHGWVLALTPHATARQQNIHLLAAAHHTTTPRYGRCHHFISYTSRVSGREYVVRAVTFVFTSNLG